MRTFSLIVLTVLGPLAHAQSCETPYLEKCEKVSNAAGAFRAQPAMGEGGAKAVYAAQQQAFSETASTWESARNACTQMRKSCRAACTSPANQCESKIGPLIYQANQQMLTNQDQANQAGAGVATQDDQESDTARREAASQKYGEDASVQNVNNEIYLCQSDPNRCTDSKGNYRVYNPNGSLTITPPNGAAGARSVINSPYDAAGFRTK